MLKLKSILASVMVFVCCTGFVSAEAYYEINAEGGVIYHEDPEECEEFDIDTSVPDDYINSLDDPERIKLLMIIFHSPGISSGSLDKYDIPVKTDEEILSDAKALASLPIEELRKEAERTKEQSKKYQREATEYYEQHKIENRRQLDEAMRISLEDALEHLEDPMGVKYYYTLQGVMNNPRTGKTDVWIKSRVEWGVSGNEVIGITPHTTTGKNSYYTWNGGIDGDQYLSGGRGYVNKSRAFFITESEDDAWEVFVNGVFNHTSTPISKDEGYRQY